LLRRDAGPLERFPAHFQQQAMLGIEGVGLAARDSEELGIELRHLVEKRSVANVVRARGPRVGVVKTLPRPAVAGNFADGVGAARQHLPERLGGDGAARKAAGHADHRNRFRRSLVRLRQLLLQLLDDREGLAERAL
jgi:hypothetical protein